MQTQHIHLFETALKDTKYIELICLNTAGEDQFLTTLSANKLTFEEMITLIETTPNNLIKSLMIFHILRTSYYLDSLEGDSLLLRLNDHEKHTPSRLNALIQMLDLSILSSLRIQQLQPEAAVSILCSIPHFHQFKLDQIRDLFKVYPQNTVIAYWLQHFYAMPNAYFLLSQLLQLYPKMVSDVIQSPMYKLKKSALCRKMLEHLELFSLQTSLLEGAHEEDFLARAIHLFLNGHEALAYKQYILFTADKLLNKSHVFSIKTTQQLIALQSREEFQLINNRTAYLTNYYLRKNAQAGDVQVFYTRGKPNVDSMIQPVQLKPIIPKIIETSAQDSTSMPTIIENTVLIDNLARHEKKVSAFDYFLMHCNEKTELINMAINDYLAYFSKNNLSQFAHTTASLILRPELNTQIKETLFTAFLQHPTLHNEEIVLQLVQFDANRLFQYFGKQGTIQAYEHLIKLCKLIPHKKLNEKHLAMVTQAEAEAVFELHIGEDTGFFSPLINFIKRCWFYGWTGFFKPNQPVYVIPASELRDITTPNTEINTPLQVLSKSQNAANNLYQLLNEIQAPYAIESLDAIIEALRLYSAQHILTNESSLRTKMDALFPIILREIKQNENLRKWFSINSADFVSNRFRLIELRLYNNQNPLLSDIDDGDPLLQHLKNELSCQLPKQKIITLEKNKMTTDLSAQLKSQAIKAITTISQNFDSFFGINPSNYPSQKHNPTYSIILGK